MGSYCVFVCLFCFGLIWLVFCFLFFVFDKNLSYSFVFWFCALRKQEIRIVGTTFWQLSFACISVVICISRCLRPHAKHNLEELSMSEKYSWGQCNILWSLLLGSDTITEKQTWECDIFNTHFLPKWLLFSQLLI